MTNPKQLNQMMRQMEKMQQDMAATQEALAKETVEGSAGGGVVKAVVTGNGELQSIEIAPEVIDPEEVEMLQDLIVAAVSEGIRAARELQTDQMGSVTGGVDLGPFGDLFG